MSDPITITPGAQTSEFRVAQQANLWGIINTVLGFIVIIGPQLVTIPAVANNAKWLSAIGGLVTLASIISRALVQQGFIQGRNDLKLAAMTIQPAPQVMSPPLVTLPPQGDVMPPMPKPADVVDLNAPRKDGK